jgi:thymidylate kinase
VIIPNIYDYDYIIQDRGILSGYAYGEACGNHFDDLRLMSARNVESADENHHVLPLTPEHIYDSVIYLRGDSLKGLQKAKSSKQEFDGGDAMESRGDNFIIKVSKNMEQMSLRFKTTTINVENKSIDEVHSEIMKSLGLEKYV